MRRGVFLFRGRALAWMSSLSAAGLLSLAACGSAPVVHLHSLMPSDIAPAADARARPASGAPLVIVLDPIRMPAQVDQPQWLVQMPDGSLASLEQERWASPLRDEMQQAVLEGLVVRYGAVELRHLGGATAANAADALRVGIDVRRFDSIPGQEARIEGSWTIGSASSSSTASSKPLHCDWLIRERASGSVGTLADAHRRAVMRLSDGIGAAMAAIKRGDRPACPAVSDIG